MAETRTVIKVMSRHMGGGIHLHVDHTGRLGLSLVSEGERIPKAKDAQVWLDQKQTKFAATWLKPFLIRIGAVQEYTPQPEGKGEAANDFISKNLNDLMRRERGRIKKAPFPLSLFIDAVVTKETL